MHTALDLAAARLALLVARSTVSHTLPIRGPTLRVGSSSERLDSNDLAERLAEMEKPIHCSAREAGGSIEISYSPLAPGTQDADWHATTIRESEKRRGFLSYLGRAATVDPDNTMVLCFGRNEAMLLSVSAVEQWHRQYHVARVQLRGDRVDNPRCSDWPQYIEAKRQGARGVLIFSSGSDHPVRAWINIRKA